MPFREGFPKAFSMFVFISLLRYLVGGKYSCFMKKLSNSFYKIALSQLIFTKIYSSASRFDLIYFAVTSLNNSFMASWHKDRTYASILTLSRYKITQIHKNRTVKRIDPSH